jgi:serine/threonine-protein kinase
MPRDAYDEIPTLGASAAQRELAEEGLPAKGSTIDGAYRVLDILGRGAFGVVYRCARADAPLTAPPVALKLLTARMDGPDATRFARERDILSAVVHPNVVRCLGCGLHDGRKYIVMEYADGGDLDDLMRQRERLAEAEAGWILYQLCAGLRAAATVHRDLKPSNVLLARNGAGLDLRVGDIGRGAVAKVSDFGLAMAGPRSTAQRVTRSQDVMGTPHYMSPEQCRSVKTVTLQSDIYSLGVMFYEMLAGRRPFNARSPFEVMQAHCEAEPDYPAAFSDPAVRLLRQMLAKDPARRPAALVDVQAELMPILALPATWSYVPQVQAAKAAAAGR